MSELKFWSQDHRFGLRIGEKQLRKMLRFCCQSLPYETGGILVGYYNQARNCAIITGISAAPHDSLRGKSWFIRGVDGLQSLLQSLWHKDGHYYLGEWHFHPYASPHPSGEDYQQMQKICEDKKYQCPEPLLFIVGGNPKGKWQIEASVVLKDQATIPLISLEFIDEYETGC